MNIINKVTTDPAPMKNTGEHQDHQQGNHKPDSNEGSNEHHQKKETTPLVPMMKVHSEHHHEDHK
ncbi:hypothetical protein CVS40_5334 [Lucilia cuprina]|nr:hypothetical protein CVS40_5334 [Lucilia cuprina]